MCRSSKGERRTFCEPFAKPLRRNELSFGLIRYTPVSGLMMDLCTATYKFGVTDCIVKKKHQIIASRERTQLDDHTIFENIH
ncbi:hypothetical protein RCL_jg29444.t1 [Rhizophagus clarus]|uniref:Uncharacterized protein n=1 Tax=Rhizophagus clarus TaxID=94130 RepID=A0A8H3KZP6_9GLOM|nr:hypothetical protein RCL_jg29444.t1 [Rhizophagus clarus]